MRNLTVIPSLLDLFTTIVYIGGEIHKMLIGDFTIKISTRPFNKGRYQVFLPA
jgi:hypothetical protein